MELRDIIKKYRRENKMTMEKFAEKCGLSKGYISMLEKGKHPHNERPLVPSLETYKKLAECMGMELDDLLRMVDGDSVISLRKPPDNWIQLFADPLTPEQQELQKQTEEIKDIFARMPPDLRVHAIALLKGLVPPEQSLDDPGGSD